MFDPFQIKKETKAKATSPPPALRDLAKAPPSPATPPGLAVRRSRQTLRAVALIDLLTAGDEALHAYLSAQPQGAASLGAPPAETTSTPQAVSADALDPLLDMPPPPLGSVDFQQLKQALLKQCQQTITQQYGNNDSTMILSRCSIPGHCIHSISPTGEIQQHYVLENLDSSIMRRCHAELEADQELSYIEVYSARLELIKMDGSVRRLLL